MYATRDVKIKGYPFLALLLPAISNALLVGWELEIYIGGGFWLNALYVAIGEAAVLLTLGSLMAFMTLSRNFNMPINQISNQINSIVMALAGAERVFELMDEEPEFDEGYVTLVNAKLDENGNITESAQRTGMWAWRHPHQADGTVTYTFTLRQGVNWVDSQGRTVAPLIADDFVAGLCHVMDAAGGLEYLLEGVIQGASAYISGENRDFTAVGVQAVDDYTLRYTLTGDIPYFMTMLGYSVFAPLSRSYYTSRGGKFGSDNYSYSGGLHGVGASVTNALSEWLKVEVYKKITIFVVRKR